MSSVRQVSIRPEGRRRIDSRYLLIREAILDKQQLAGLYKGKRMMACPHALGWLDERPYVLCYRFLGPSLKTERQDLWQWMALQDFAHLAMRSGHWYSAPPETRPPLPGVEIDVEVRP